MVNVPWFPHPAKSWEISAFPWLLPIMDVPHLPLLLLCYLNIVHFLTLGVYTIIRVGHGFSIF